MRALLLGFGVTLCSTMAGAQSILVVDAASPAQFQDIPPALQAAQAGDVILVVPSGTYSAFTLDKGVVIRAAGGQFAVGGDVFIQNVPVEERAGISGMTCPGSVLVTDCQGHVFLERVTLTAVGSFLVDRCDNFSGDVLEGGPEDYHLGGVIAVNESSARLSAITVTAGLYAALYVTASSVTLSSPREVVGAPGWPGYCDLFGCFIEPTEGLPGIHASDSTLIIHGTSMQTIDGGPPGVGMPAGECFCPPQPFGPSALLANSTLLVSRVLLPNGVQGGTLVRDDSFALHTATEDFLLGTSLGWTVDSVQPGNVLFLLSDTAGSLPVQGFTGPNLAAVPGGFFLLVPAGHTDAAGKLTVSLPGSADPSLLGFVAISQAVVVGDVGGLYLTNALTRVMGENFQDCNGNGVPDGDDIATGTSQDCDGNGYPDECDFDCDGDGLVDACEIAADPGLDCNGNGILDQCIDLESDCNGNGFPDSCDVNGGFSPDCNGNGIPDECDLSSRFSPDCNGNGTPDECDVASGFSLDCNGNGIPDECELDCNGNGVQDDCDIASGFSADCNTNGIPDECELDCNGNGVQDDCDIAAGSSQDINHNGIPDECEQNATHRVPADFLSIQQAIDASLHGDTILVADGSWLVFGGPAIDLRGKAVHLRSENGPGSCILDGRHLSRGLVFQSGEGPDTVVEGFTLHQCGTSGIAGGGAYVAGASPTFRNCVFDNCVADDGGAVYLLQSGAAFRNCRFLLNAVNRNGGAVHCQGSSPSFRDCLFESNFATGTAAAVYAAQQSTGDFTQCTFARNTALGAGAEAIAFHDSDPTLSGCILWLNAALPADVALTSDGLRPALLRYCDLEKGIPLHFVDGGGNLSVDPLFVNPAARDFHLLPGSPCIDAGDPLFAPEPGETDIDGEPRVQDAAVDIGADET